MLGLTRSRYSLGLTFLRIFCQLHVAVTVCFSLFCPIITPLPSPYAPRPLSREKNKWLPGVSVSLSLIPRLRIFPFPPVTTQTLHSRLTTSHLPNASSLYATSSCDRCSREEYSDVSTTSLFPTPLTVVLVVVFFFFKTWCWLFLMFTSLSEWQKLLSHRIHRKLVFFLSFLSSLPVSVRSRQQLHPRDAILYLFSLTGCTILFPCTHIGNSRRIAKPPWLSRHPLISHTSQQPMSWRVDRPFCFSIRPWDTPPWWIPSDLRRTGSIVDPCINFSLTTGLFCYWS